MTARIAILSGPQLGQTLLVPADVTVIGGEPEKGVLLEPGADARNIISGATLEKTPTGWQIETLGDACIWVNETQLSGPTALASGDIVRLSHQGPDFCFEIDPLATGTPAEVTTTTPDLSGTTTNLGTEPTADPVVAAPLPDATPRAAKPTARSRNPRRKSGPLLILLNLVGVALGGAGGIALMLFLLNFGLGRDPFGIWETRALPPDQPDRTPERPATEPAAATKQPAEIASASDPALAATSPAPVPVAQQEPSSTSAPAIDAIYLVVVQELRNNTLFPFSSACAIGNGRLLTSGQVVVELQQLLATQNGESPAFKVLVARGGDLQQREPVERLFAHRVFRAADQSTENKLYFDFGLLEITSQPRPHLTPQDATTTPGNAQGSSVQLLGFSHQGEPTTRFQDADLVDGALKVLNVTRGEVDGKRQSAGQLLHLYGPLGDNLAGSPLLTDTGQLVAIYATAADVSRDANLQRLAGKLHFAPSVAAIADWFGETLPATAIELPASDTQ